MNVGAGQACVSVSVNWLKEIFMRILLQQRETGQYFKDIGNWTENSGEAMNFLSSTAAIDFCVLNKFSGVQIVLKFDEQRYDIVLPVLPEHGRSKKESGGPHGG